MSQQFIILLVLAVVAVIGAGIYFQQADRAPKDGPPKEGPDSTDHTGPSGDGDGGEGGGD